MIWFKPMGMLYYLFYLKISGMVSSNMQIVRNPLQIILLITIWDGIHYTNIEMFKARILFVLMEIIRSVPHSIWILPKYFFWDHIFYHWKNQGRKLIFYNWNQHVRSITHYDINCKGIDLIWCYSLWFKPTVIWPTFFWYKELEKWSN